MSTILCRKPYLAADDIRLEQPHTVTISRGDAVIDVTATDPHAAHRLLEALAAMRRPEWQGWSAPGAGELDELLETLWTAGMIAEAETGHEEAAAEHSLFASSATRTYEWLLQARTQVDPVRLDAAARAIRLGRHELAEANFFVETLRMQLCGWQQFCPPSARLAEAVLDAFLARRAPDVSAADDFAGGVYDTRAVQIHLHTLAVLMLFAASDSARRVVLPPQQGERRSALTLLLEAERLADDGTRRFGESRYHEALRRGASDRLAAGTYLQQFYVTSRFVEVIAPMMIAELRVPLKQRMYRYYDEELGHEAHELESCLRLGMTEEQVRAAIPLPLFVSYIEVLRYVAATDPVGFLLAVPVAEGLPGMPTPVNELLLASGVVADDARGAVTRHAEINVELDHGSLARKLAAYVPSISAAAQQRALANLALIVELNSRCWNLLHDYFSREELPLYPEWFGIRPETWLGLDGRA